MKKAEVVIIGGGIFGTLLAYTLASRGARGILLLEQDVIAAGSSGKATGGLRHQFADELDIRFSIAGIQFYRDFIASYGSGDEDYRPPVFYQYGYLFLCSTPASWQAFQQYARLQNTLGVPTRLLSPTEVSERVPQLLVDDLLGATFCSTDGYSDPGAMTRALAHAARSAGVTIQEHSPVTAIQVRRQKVEGVSTPRENIATRLVVNASGAYAALTARLAGIPSLPVWPLKRQLYQTDAFDRLPQELPMVVDASTGFHFRRRENGITLTMPSPASSLNLDVSQRLEPRAFTLDLDEALWPLIQVEIQRRCPTLAQASIRRAWAGLYEMTPDEHPILGPTEIEGFLCGCGFSGHGFMHAPLAAQLLAESILAPHKNLPELARFRLARFHEGQLIPTTPLL